MTNYFIKGMPTGQSMILEENRIAYYEMEIEDEIGIIVDKEDIDRITTLLEMKIYKERPTIYEGVTEIFLKEKEPVHEDIIETFSEEEGSVHEIPSTSLETGFEYDAFSEYSVRATTEWSGYNKSGFIDICREVLIPELKRSIAIHVPHNTTKRAINDGRFHIWIWSSPSGISNSVVPEKIWDIETDNRDEAFISTGEGVPIIADNGFNIAELIGENNLFIHYDICHVGTRDEQKIFRRLLEEVINELNITPEEKERRRIAKEEYEREQEQIKREQERIEREERKKRNRNLYIDLCSRRLKTRVKELKEIVGRANSKVTEMQTAIVSLIREANEAGFLLENFGDLRNNELEKYALEFDKLMGSRGVTNIEVDDKKIKVFTDTLYCTDPRTDILHEIGEFRIEISFNGKEDCVRWFNLTRDINGNMPDMQAPHVFKNGKACLGNAAEIFPELIANFEFAAVALVAIQFIESVNTDDSAGKHIDSWPIAKKYRRDIMEE